MFFALFALVIGVKGQSICNPPTNVTATTTAYNKIHVSWDVPNGTTHPMRLDLYNNADMVTHPGAGHNGYDVSALYGGQNTWGWNVNRDSKFWIADDFTINTQSNITEMEFYCYQTGSTTTSSITAIYLCIYDSQPLDSTAVPIWGSEDTNLLTYTGWTGIYRTTAAALTDSTRPIMKMKALINTVLPAGTYWVKVAVSGSIASGPWLNPRAITSELSTGNAMQYVPSTGLWQALVDGVSLEQMGVPFIVRGSFVNEDLLGFNVYRDGVQINSDTIQSLYYNDENLDENREYCYSVQAVYDSCLSIHSNTACSTTLFNPCVISSIPWTDNLDQYAGYTAGNVDLPSCYFRFNDATGTTASYFGLPYVYNSSTYSHSGNNSFRFYTTTTATYPMNQYLVLPLIDSVNYTINQLQLQLWARLYSTYAGRLEVGVMNSPTDTASFFPIDTIIPASTTYEEFEVFFNQYSGTGRYIALKFSKYTSAALYMHVDDLTLDLIPNCIRPSSINYSNLDAHSVTFNWQPTGTETQWTFEYKSSVDTAWTSIENISTSSYTLTSLDDATSYTFEVRVKAICGSGEESDWREGTFSFLTDCDAIAELPWSDNFDSYAAGTSAAFPICYTRINDASGTSNYYPYVYNSTTYSHSGNNSLYFYGSTSSTYANNQYAVLPAIDINTHPINTLQLTFYARRSSTTTYLSELIVGIMSNPTDTSTFVPVDTIVPTSSTHEQYLVNFSTYQGSGDHIALKVKKMTASNYVYLDDIAIEEIQTCLRPTNNAIDNLSQTDATVVWDPVVGGSTYNIMYKAASDSVWIEVNSIVDTFYTINSLSPGTYYQYQVSATCTDGNTSYWCDEASFMTLCNAITNVDLPYTENFDTYGTASGAFPDCWRRPIAYVSGTSTYPAIVNSPSVFPSPVSAPASLRFQSKVAWAATPQLDVDIHTLRANFWLQKEGASSGAMQIGVMSDISDTSTFEVVETINLQEEDTWKFIEVLFDSTQITGIGNYIALRQITTVTNYYYWIDDFTVDLIPSCLRPTNLTIDTANTNSTTIAFSWTPGGNETGWTVEYREYNSEGAWQVIAGLSTTSCIIPNLNPVTNYYVRVKADCGAGDESDYSVVSLFKTECGEISQLPWKEDFELYPAGSSALFPNCFNRINDASGTYNYYPYVYNSTTYSYSGLKSLYFYASTGSDYANNQYTVLPAINTAILPLNTVQLSFFARKSSTTSYLSQCIVGIMDNPNDTATFVPVATIEPYSATHDEYFVTFENYQGTGKYIAIKVQKLSAYNYVYLDDITINTIQSCFRPTNLSVANLSQNSIDISWIQGGGETEWEVAYKAENDTSWIVVPQVYDTTFSVTGLNPATTYLFKVKSICGTEETDYTNTVEATTLCLPMSIIPYFENFDTYGTGTGTYPDCWLRYYSGTVTTYPYINSSYSYSSPGALYLYGTTSYYSMAIMPEIDASIPIENLKLSFKARKTSAAYNISVGVMSNPSDPSTFTVLETFSPSSTTTFEDFSVYFYGTGQMGQFIAFKCGNLSATSAMYVDNVELTYAEDCVVPQRLRATNILSHSADLVWHSASTESLWEYCYVPTGQSIQNTPVYSVDINHFTLSGLTANTTYDFYVRTLCGTGSVTAWSTVCTFTTGCEPISIIPYSESFDTYGIGTNIFPSCWTKTGTGSNYVVGGTNSYYYSGVGGLYFTTSSTTYLYTSLPEFAIDLNQLQLSFFGKIGNDAYTFDVGVMTDPTDTSTFELISSITRRSAVWNTYTIPFTSYTGIGKFIAIRVRSTATFGIDNLTVDYAPICVKPINLSVSNIGLYNADLTWTPGRSETEWEVKYDLEGFNPNVSGTSIIATSNPLNLTGLQSGTYYDVYVRALCGGTDGNSEWSSVSNFRTLCDVVNTLPYIEDFNSYGTGVGTFPTCWERNTTNSTTTKYPYISSTYSYNSPGALYFYSTSSTYNIVTTPRLNNINTLQATFKLYKTSAAYQLQVGVMTDPYIDSTFVLISTLSPSATSTWEEFEIPFNTYTGTGQYIAFKSQVAGSSSYMYLDNVVVDIIPTCNRPIELIATAITNNSITLSWEERNNATGWEIEYGVHGFTPGTGIITTANTNNGYLLSGLNSGTAYDIYVRSICSPTDMSANSDLLTISTMCDPLDLPYVENFDIGYTGTAYNAVGSTPNCWVTYSNGTNDAYIPHIVSSGTYAYINSAPNSLVMTSGSTTTYGNTKFAVLPEFSTPISRLTLNFWYRNESATYGTLSIGYVTDITDLNSTFTSIETFTNSTVGLTDSVDFSTLTSIPANARIAFQWSYNSTFYSCCIDDIEVTENPCEVPTNLAASNITINSADITWSAGSYETEWTLEYKETTASDWTPVLCSTNSYSLIGLLSNTEYQVRLKAHCSATNQSIYTGIVTFTTQAEGVTYTITASTGDNGTITPSGNVTVEEGASQLFTITANNGYLIEDVLVDNVSQGAISSYTFTNVQANHTIFASFAAGIDENILQNTIFIYPNPANDILNVKTTQRFEKVEITSLLGQLIYSQAITEDNFQINIADLTSGVYFIRLTGDNGMITKKFVKK